MRNNEGPVEKREKSALHSPRAVLERQENSQAGIEEIWLINPFENAILAEVKTPAGYVTEILSSGRLESTVLPGFWIEVSWLWQEELPPTLRCLREIMQ